MNFFSWILCIQFTVIFYLCDFVVSDIKIAVYLESPQKIDFNLVSDFLVSEISEKMGFNYSQ